MSELKNKIDFVAIISVTNANSNGDPLNGNRPRSDYNGFGEISDVCIKRKIRNRMQDLGEKIFVQSDERCDDGMKTLNDRASCLSKIKDEEEFYKTACNTWSDVRAFGQVFTFSSLNCKSKGVRGPVSIHQAVSVDPVEIESMQITKSVNGEKEDTKKKSRDTMGTKHFVRFGLYKIKGSINCQLAGKTGFSSEDAQIIKKSLATLFVNDASAARPDGSMEVIKLLWWEHNCPDGQYSSAKVHNLVNIKAADGVIAPSSVDDYVITVDTLPGLECEDVNCQ